MCNAQAKWPSSRTVSSPWRTCRSWLPTLTWSLPPYPWRWANEYLREREKKTTGTHLNVYSFLLFESNLPCLGGEGHAFTNYRSEWLRQEFLVPHIERPVASVPWQTAQAARPGYVLHPAKVTTTTLLPSCWPKMITALVFFFFFFLLFFFG